MGNKNRFQYALYLLEKEDDMTWDDWGVEEMPIDVFMNIPDARAYKNTLTDCNKNRKIVIRKELF